MVADINFLTNRLQEHPFNLHLSEIQLSNDLDQRDLYQLMCKVLNHIKGGASDFQNQTPSGIVYFLQILQYETREG